MLRPIQRLVPLEVAKEHVEPPAVDAEPQPQTPLIQSTSSMMSKYLRRPLNRKLRVDLVVPFDHHLVLICDQCG